MAGGVRSCEDGEEEIRKRRREKEKEKTRLRERKRRSITTNILDGLRKHGGYRLPHRPDINDVLRALAREAGWTVLPDGTTYRTPTPTPTPKETSHVSYSPSSAAVPVGGGGGGGNGSSTSLLPFQAGPTAEFASYIATGGARFATSGPTLYAGEKPSQYQEQQLGVIDFM